MVLKIYQNFQQFRKNCKTGQFRLSKPIRFPAIHEKLQNWSIQALKTNQVSSNSRKIAKLANSGSQNQSGFQQFTKNCKTGQLRLSKPIRFPAIHEKLHQRPIQALKTNQEFRQYSAMVSTSAPPQCQNQRQQASQHGYQLDTPIES